MKYVKWFWHRPTIKGEPVGGVNTVGRSRSEPVDHEFTSATSSHSSLIKIKLLDQKAVSDCLKPTFKRTATRSDNYVLNTADTFWTKAVMLNIFNALLHGSIFANISC